MAGEKVVAQNRKAYHDFFIEDTFEAGIVLTGTEIKAIRQGRANLKDSYARVENGEIFLHNMHISPYEQGNRFNHDPGEPGNCFSTKARFCGSTARAGSGAIRLSRSGCT